MFVYTITISRGKIPTLLIPISLIHLTSFKELVIHRLNPDLFSTFSTVIPSKTKDLGLHIQKSRINDYKNTVEQRFLPMIGIEGEGTPHLIQRGGGTWS